MIAVSDLNIATMDIDSGVPGESGLDGLLACPRDDDRRAQPGTGQLHVAFLLELSKCLAQVAGCGAPCLGKLHHGRTLLSGFEVGEFCQDSTKVSVHVYPPAKTSCSQHRGGRDCRLCQGMSKHLLQSRGELALLFLGDVRVLIDQVHERLENVPVGDRLLVVIADLDVPAVNGDLLIQRWFRSERKLQAYGPLVAVRGIKLQCAVAGLAPLPPRRRRPGRPRARDRRTGLLRTALPRFPSRRLCRARFGEQPP